MLLVSLFLFTDLFSEPRSFPTARNRRMHLSSSPSSLRHRSPASGPRWYYANFFAPPDHSALSAHGISLSPDSFISLTTYNLYLTPNQASYLLASHLAELSEVEDKLISIELSVADAHHLLVEVADDFEPSDHPFEFHALSSNVYSVSSGDLHQAAAYLQTLATVYAVTPAVRPDVLNHMSVGYTQSHTGELQDDFSFPRPLHARGIQGNGTVITVIDTPLDPTSTFFYDTVPIGPHHRKLLYVHAFVQPMKISEHGTHVCGSLAGNSLDPEASKFNGMAPMAKIVHMPLEMANMMMRSLAQNMRTWGSHISTNSWGTAGYVASFVRAFDQWAFHNPDLTITFSAGNDRARDWARLGGSSSVGSPGACRNVLTIGSLAQLSVSNPPEDRNYVLTIIDRNPFRGHAIFRAKRLPFSADPFVGNITRIATMVGRGKQARVITNVDELEPAVSNAENIRFVITTVKIDNLDEDIPFGVFWVNDPAFIEKNQTARILSVAQEFRTGDQFVGSFSSMGPSATGIVKPDVSAPGELIFSARSSPIGPPNHDVNPLTLHLLSGTSMASPHVSGSLALIEQWLRDEYDLPNPSSMLMRATAVTCAEPLDAAQKWPDMELGYGVMHLAKYLPMLGPEGKYRFVYLNHALITIPGHLVSGLEVTGRRRELRIALAYLDVTVSGDSRIPLFVDLDLVVVSPSGRIFRGNHYQGDHEEHFSTIERVIIRPHELEIGVYKVHVLAIAPIPVPHVRFGIVAVGELSETSEFEFDEATTCLPCGQGMCNFKTKLCNCSAAVRMGQSCQLSPVVLISGSPGEGVEEEIPPLGIRYIIFRNPDKNKSTLGMHIHSITGPVALRLFVGTPPWMGRTPAEFKENMWDNMTKTQTWERDTMASEVMVMLRNDFSTPRKYRIKIKPGKNWKVLVIVLGTIGGVLAVTGLIIACVCCFGRQSKPKEEAKAKAPVLVQEESDASPSSVPE